MGEKQKRMEFVTGTGTFVTEGKRTLKFLQVISYCGFGGLGVACWPLVPKFAFSTQVAAEAIRIFGAKKNPQHAFLRRGSKAVGPMS